jgi:GMP synthase (glutamine-hydrolysing)
MTSATRAKRILLIDAVVWSPAYPETSPFRDVRHWYARWLVDLPETTLACVAPAADLPAALAEVDGVIVSGSPRDAWSDDPVNDLLCELVRRCQERSVPFLGVCYGHQLLARALGGVVNRHPDGLELGNTLVRLTPAGRASPLFTGITDAFTVISSHADAVLTPAPGTELLVRGDFTENQGFHWRNLLFGVQFHPETDPETLRFIWSTRRDAWRPQVRFDLDQVLEGLEPTPMAANILRNFVTHIVP